jgi:hypothetical protein
MKFHSVPTIIAIGISLLISLGFYSIHSGVNKYLLSLGTLVFLASTLTMTIATSFESPRTTTNIRVVSGIFFFVAFAMNAIYLFLSNFSSINYIVFNGILFLIFVLITFSLNKNDV